jgi:hypothetical protein
MVSTLVSHYCVEFDLGKSALQLLEGHIHKRTFDQKRTFRQTARNRKNMSSQARPNFHVGPRLIRRYRLRNFLSENSLGANRRFQFHERRQLRTCVC